MNVVYDCGHTGRLKLPPQYDDRPPDAEPIPVQKLLTDTGHEGELRPWNCMACHRKQVLGAWGKYPSPQPGDEGDHEK